MLHNFDQFNILFIALAYSKCIIAYKLYYTLPFLNSYFPIQIV